VRAVVVLAVVTAAALTTPTATAAAAPGRPPGDARAAGAAGDSPGAKAPDAATRRAEAAAKAAARRVDDLTEVYEQRSAAAERAADLLAAAFAASADVDRTREEDAHRLRAAAVAHSARVRALYVEGGAAGLVVTVLAADDPDEAMWRAASVDRIRADLLRRSGLDMTNAGTRAARSTRAATAAEVTDLRLAVALRELQDDAAAAREALGRARATLDRLDARARTVRAAQEAAARLAAAQAAAQARRLARSSGASALGIPADYEHDYRAAATSCPGMDWTLLAAVGQVESGHGRNNGPSSAGAIGPMQFMPATFDAYGVDGNHDGATDAWSAPDAIWSAAAYLCDGGAGEGTARGVHDALFRYNRAEWYVDLVLAAQRAIEDATGRGDATTPPDDRR